METKATCLRTSLFNAELFYTKISIHFHLSFIKEWIFDLTNLNFTASDNQHSFLSKALAKKSCCIH